MNKRDAKFIQRLARDVWFRSRGMTRNTVWHTIQHPDHMPPERAKAIYDYAIGTPNRWVIYCALHCSNEREAWIDWEERVTTQSCRADVMQAIMSTIFDELLSGANPRQVDAFESKFRIA